MSQPPLSTGRAAFTAYGSAPLINLRGVLEASLRIPSTPLGSLGSAFASVEYLCFGTSLRLRAFAFSPRPSVRGFPTLRLLRPLRHFLGHWGFRWGLPYLLSTPLRIPQEASRVYELGLKQDDLLKCCSNEAVEPL